MSVKNLILVPIALFLTACECGVRIESKPTPTTVEFGQDVLDGGTQASDPDPEVQAVLNKFTPEQIDQMFMDIPISDKRPESQKNFDLLFKAVKAIERNNGNPRLQKADRVNDALRGL